MTEGTDGPSVRLTDEEAEHLHHLAVGDDLTPNDYTVERGQESGHAFALNGFSMAFDLTAAADVDGDTIDEADAIVARRNA